MKPGLDAITRLCAALGNPQRKFRSIHIAGTNGKGALAAMLDCCLRSCGKKCFRYTSPHLVSVNERFFLDGRPAGDACLERAAAKVKNAADGERLDDLTFFEALTAMAFLVCAESGVDAAVLETGLGGRLDATNIVVPEISVITKIGLDHCAWLGGTVREIAAEKAGIVKPGVPVVMGKNGDEAVETVMARAKELSSPFFYAPDIAGESEIPAGFPLAGSFNRENAVTAIAALKVLRQFGNPAISSFDVPAVLQSLANVVWPGRFQRVGNAIVDGAHNPPAASALADALASCGVARKSLVLIAAFCSDKDIDGAVVPIAPFIRKAFTVRTANERSVEPERLASVLESCGIDAAACGSLEAALEAAGFKRDNPPRPEILVCGSLFLAGEALAALGEFPWPSQRRDSSELLAGAR